MNSNWRLRTALTLGAAAGGLLAGAFLPMAVANADEYFYTPDPTETGVVTPAWGTSEFGEQIETGAAWNTNDLSGGLGIADSLYGNDTHTSIGTFSSDVFQVTESFPGDPGNLADGSTIDLSNYGLGFGNELVSATAGAGDISQGIYDTAITPFGDFFLF
jgi:hypothetical protein